MILYLNNNVGSSSSIQIHLLMNATATSHGISNSKTIRRYFPAQTSSEINTQTLRLSYAYSQSIHDKNQSRNENNYSNTATILVDPGYSQQVVIDSIKPVSSNDCNAGKDGGTRKYGYSQKSVKKKYCYSFFPVKKFAFMLSLSYTL